MKNIRIIASVLVGFLILVLAYVLLVEWNNRESQQPITFQEPDLSDHPLYRDYKFGDSENVIDVGIQPLWIPPSIITEVMKRDLLLKNALSGLGKEIRFHSFLKGADVNYFLKRGRLEVGVEGDMPALTIAANSNALITSTLMQRGFLSIIAKRHILMKKLRGKRIGYAFGSNAHYAVLQALYSDGLNESDVRMIPLDVNEMPHALNKDEIEAFSAWEPTPSIALEMFQDFVVIHRSISTGYMYFSRNFADENSEAVNQIVASQIRAINWLKREKENLLRASNWAVEASIEIFPHGLSLTAEQYAALAKKDLLSTVSPSRIQGMDLEESRQLYNEFIFLKNLGKIPKSTVWEDVKSNFDFRIVDDINSQSELYMLDALKVNLVK